MRMYGFQYVHTYTYTYGIDDVDYYMYIWRFYKDFTLFWIINTMNQQSSYKKIIQAVSFSIIICKRVGLYNVDNITLKERSKIPFDCHDCVSTMSGIINDQWMATNCTLLTSSPFTLGRIIIITSNHSICQYVDNRISVYFPSRYEFEKLAENKYCNDINFTIHLRTKFFSSRIFPIDLHPYVIKFPAPCVHPAATLSGVPGV